MSFFKWLIIAVVGVGVCGLVGVGNPDIEQTWIQDVVLVLFGIPGIIACFVLASAYLEAKMKSEGESSDS